MIVQRLHVSLLVFWILAASCGNSSTDLAQGGAEQPAQREAVMVFGAASTTNALVDLCRLFQQGTGIEVVNNFASSSALAQQIISGAGADVFLSANVKWVDALEKESLVARRVHLLRNRLVVITAIDSGLNLRTSDDLKSSPIERLALADPSSAPAGIYAKQALESLGLWRAMEKRVVAGADVRQALAYVEQGAVEAGIVYATDAAISDRVKVILEIPADASAPIVYPLVLLKSAEGKAAAESLYVYLQSGEAAAVFENYGFGFSSKHVEAAQ